MSGRHLRGERAAAAFLATVLLPNTILLAEGLGRNRSSGLIQQLIFLVPFLLSAVLLCGFLRLSFTKSASKHDTMLWAASTICWGLMMALLIQRCWEGRKVSWWSQYSIFWRELYLRLDVWRDPEMLFWGVEWLVVEALVLFISPIACTLSVAILVNRLTVRPSVSADSWTEPSVPSAKGKDLS